MSGLAPRAPGDSVRPRRPSGVVVRPLNFTVRVRDKIRLCSELDKTEELKSRGQDALFDAAGERARLGFDPQ